jgi:HK97 family phage portal protein
MCMGLLTRAFAPRAAAPVLGGSSYVPGLAIGGTSTASYQSTTRAYTNNEIISSGINLLAKSSAEPHIIGRRWRRNRRDIRNEQRYLNACGIPNRPGRQMVDALLVRNGFWEEVDSHPLVVLLNNPNPYTSRGQFWSQIVVDYYLAGNAYGLKARYTDGLLEGAPGELWRLRPDRMKPIPGDMAAGEPFIKAYEYTIDARTKQMLPAADVMHFKAPNPLDPYVGLPPLLALMPRVTIDEYMRRFLGTFFERGGAGVGASLNIKGDVDQATKDDIRARFKRLFSGGQYDVLVTSAEDVTYTPFGLDRGLRDALPKEIDAVNEARMAMVLGIPGSILGLLIGYESSSYANKKADWAVFWDITMAPLLSGFDDVLNLSLVPEFGGIDEVVFDLSDIRALQEDEDLLQERARKNWAAGLASFEESRVKLGLDPVPEATALFAVPSTAVITPTERLGEEPEPPPAPRLPAPTPAEEEPATALLPPPPRQLGPGRPRLEDDASARAIHIEALRLRAQSPSLAWEHIAARVGVGERTLREYRRRFADE